MNSSSSAPPSQTAVSIPAKQPNPGPVIIDHLLALFLQDYLPSTHNKITHSHEYGLSWAQYMPSISNKSPVLTQSLAAVSLSIVGRSNHDEKLIKRSFEVYGSAIKSLRGVLRREDGNHSQDTLASMMAMTVYEVCGNMLASDEGYTDNHESCGSRLSKLGVVGWLTYRVRVGSWRQLGQIPRRRPCLHV